MININKNVKRKLMFFILNVFLCTSLILEYMNKNLLHFFVEYGKYQCENIITRVLNIAIDEYVNEEINEKTVVYNKVGEMTNIALNVDVLNSLALNIVNRSQRVIYDLENGMLNVEIYDKIIDGSNLKLLNKGISYEVPVSMILGNSLIGSLGVSIPVRYKVIGKIRGEVISSIKEYGINNALLEVGLKINAKSKILIPMITNEENISITVPLVVKVIQGKVPDYYLGTQFIGGVN